MDTKKIKEKVTVMKIKAKAFYDEHQEAISVLIGGCIGAFIFGYYAGGKIQEASTDGFDDGYGIGYQKGQDSVMDEIWSEAVRGGGTYSQRFTNKNDGRRIRIEAELLPEKHYK